MHGWGMIGIREYVIRGFTHTRQGRVTKLIWYAWVEISSLPSFRVKI